MHTVFTFSFNFPSIKKQMFVQCVTAKYLGHWMGTGLQVRKFPDYWKFAWNFFISENFDQSDFHLCRDFETLHGAIDFIQKRMLKWSAKSMLNSCWSYTTRFLLTSYIGIMWRSTAVGTVGLSTIEGSTGPMRVLCSYCAWGSSCRSNITLKVL